MNQAGIIIAFILLFIPAEMAKQSKQMKQTKQTKPIQYNPVQYNPITREYMGKYRTKVRSRPPGSLRKGKPPGSEQDTGGSNALIPLSRLPGSPGPDNRC